MTDQARLRNRNFASDWLIKIVVALLIVLSALAMSLSFAFGDNVTINNAVDINNTINDLITINETNDIPIDSVDINDLSNEINVSKNNVSLANFDMIIKSVYLSDNATIFSGEILNYYNNISVFSSVELNLYPINNTELFAICPYSVDGKSKFNCSIGFNGTNLSKYEIYRITAESEIYNITYRDNQTINVTEFILSNYVNVSFNTTNNSIFDNLTINGLNISSNVTNITINTTSNATLNVSNVDNVTVSEIDMTIKQTSENTLIESFNFTIKFSEAYIGRYIYGDISIKENDTNIFETIEFNFAPKTEPSNISICHYEINGSGKFNCTIDRLITGLYDVYAYVVHNNKTYEIYEATYLEVPETAIDIVYDSSSIEGILNVQSSSRFGDEIIKNVNTTLNIIDPDDVVYEITELDASLSVIAINPGNYIIRAMSNILGIDTYSEIIYNVVDESTIENLTINNKTNVSINESFIENATVYLVGNNDASVIEIDAIIESIYGVDEIATIDVAIYNITKNYTTKNQTITLQNSTENMINNLKLNITNNLISNLTGNLTSNEFDNKSLDFETEIKYVNDQIKSNKTETKQIITDYSDVNAIIANSDITYELPVITKDNVTYIEFIPIESGNYTINISKDNNTIIKNFIVLEKTDYAVKKYIEPAIFNNKSNITKYNLIDVDVDSISVSENEINVTFKFDNSRVNISSMTNIENLTNIQAIDVKSINNAGIVSDIFAIDSNVTSLNITRAELILKKKNDSDVEYILYCDSWNYSSIECGDWVKSNDEFTQNETHLMFNVTHFTAYAGGGIENSIMEIYDSTDYDKINKTIFINNNVTIVANYSDSSTYLPITNGVCNVTIGSGIGTKNLTYNLDNLTYEGSFNITQNDLIDYNVSCSAPVYDYLKARDNFSIYSFANITEIKLSNVTYGYDSELVVRIIDSYTSSSIENYNVSFYSDVSEYLGSSLTNASGYAQLNVSLPVIGDQQIIANITNTSDLYYYPELNDVTLPIRTDTSHLRIKKSIYYTSARTYRVNLTIENYGDNSLNGVKISDFVPNYFNVSNMTYSNFKNKSVNILNGNFMYWNVSSLTSGNGVQINYSIVYNSSQKISGIRNMRMFGLSYD